MDNKNYILDIMDNYGVKLGRNQLKCMMECPISLREYIKCLEDIWKIAWKDKKVYDENKLKQIACESGARILKVSDKYDGDKKEFLYKFLKVAKIRVKTDTSKLQKCISIYEEKTKGFKELDEIKIYLLNYEWTYNNIKLEANYRDDGSSYIVMTKEDNDREELGGALFIKDETYEWFKVSDMEDEMDLIDKLLKRDYDFVMIPVMDSYVLLKEYCKRRFVDDRKYVDLIKILYTNFNGNLDKLSKELRDVIMEILNDMERYGEEYIDIELKSLIEYIDLRLELDGSDRKIKEQLIELKKLYKLSIEHIININDDWGIGYLLPKNTDSLDDSIERLKHRTIKNTLALYDTKKDKLIILWDKDKLNSACVDRFYIKYNGDIITKLENKYHSEEITIIDENKYDKRMIKGMVKKLSEAKRIADERKTYQINDVAIVIDCSFDRDELWECSV